MSLLVLEHETRPGRVTQHLATDDRAAAAEWACGLFRIHPGTDPEKRLAWLDWSLHDESDCEAGPCETHASWRTTRAELDAE